MKGLIRSLSRGSAIRQEVVKTDLKLNALSLEVDGLADAVGFGTVVIGGLPKGNLLLLGAVAYMQFTKATSATGIQATFDGDYAIGTVPTADADFGETGEADIIPSTALGAATAGVSPRARGANATQVMLDNTDGSLELNLNVLIDNANISADNQAMTVTGILHLAYIVLGTD